MSGFLVAIGGRTDIPHAARNVRYGPEADIHAGIPMLSALVEQDFHLALVASAEVLGWLIIKQRATWRVLLSAAILLARLGVFNGVSASAFEFTSGVDATAATNLPSAGCGGCREEHRQRQRRKQACK
jgi:hypothetical protein